MNMQIHAINLMRYFLKVLNRHAPLKKKILETNHTTSISKAIRKTIFINYFTVKTFFKKRYDHSSLRTYRKQKNYCSGLHEKERKKFFNNLNLNLFLIINYSGKQWSFFFPTKVSATQI